MWLYCIPCRMWKSTTSLTNICPGCGCEMPAMTDAQIETAAAKHRETEKERETIPFIPNIRGFNPRRWEGRSQS